MRRFRFVIVVLAIGLTVAACGGGDSGPTSTTAPAATETVKGTTSTNAPATTEASKGTTSTSTTSAAAADANEVYIGTVSVADEYAEMAAVLDSLVEVRIGNGTADMTIDFTFEAVWVFGDENNEPCVSTDRFVLTGTGSAVPTMELDLSVDLAEVLAISGCEVEEDEDDDTLPFSGSVTDGTVTGSFFGGLFVVTAERD